MNAQSLQDLYVHQLRDLYNIENQLVPALDNMAAAAFTQDLVQAFEQHRQQTQGHIQRLQQIFSGLNLSPEGVSCRVIQELIQAGDRIIGEQMPAEVKDSALIAAAQKVEHFEMAGYGAARTWAKELGYRDAADLLQQNLNEEGDADHRLSKIAERQTNKQAIAAAA